MTPRNYAIILYELISELKEENLDKTVRVFVGMLKKNNDLILGGKIIREFEDYQKEKIGIKKIYITSGKELSEGFKKELALLGEVKGKVDSSLIGGVKIMIGDTLIDGSISTRLEKLKLTMTK